MGCVVVCVRLRTGKEGRKEGRGGGGFITLIIVCFWGYGGERAIPLHHYRGWDERGLRQTCMEALVYDNFLVSFSCLCVFFSPIVCGCMFFLLVATYVCRCSNVCVQILDWLSFEFYRLLV